MSLELLANSFFQVPTAAVLSAEAPQDIVDILFSSEGIHSPDPAEQRAANLAIGSAMADAPASIYPPLHTALAAAVDRKEHDAISPTEVKIYFTPAGMPLTLTWQCTFISLCLFCVCEPSVGPQNIGAAIDDRCTCQRLQTVAVAPSLCVL